MFYLIIPIACVIVLLAHVIRPALRTNWRRREAVMGAGKCPFLEMTTVFFCKAYPMKKMKWRREDRDGAGPRELTLTPEYTVNDNLVVRAEYRHDESNKDSFDKGAGVTDAQDTIGFNAVYHF